MSRVPQRPAGRIGAAFQTARAAGRPAFIPYITAGDPDMQGTRLLVGALQRGGADVIELGVPFSDPIADGEVNQRAAERALRNGVTLRSILPLAGELRQAGAPPLVLFTYYNPIHRMGIDLFARQAAHAGVDGVLVTDLPPEEAGELAEALDAKRVDLIPLLSPTSSKERMTLVAAAGRGFVYVISRTGVTGTRDDLSAGLPGLLAAVREVCGELPIAVGFGISRPEQVRAISAHADGVVVGSALVRMIEQNATAPDLADRVEEFCRALVGR